MYKTEGSRWCICREKGGAQRAFYLYFYKDVKKDVTRMSLTPGNVQQYTRNTCALGWCLKKTIAVSEMAVLKLCYMACYICS